jgi:hypothetical protein
MPSATILMVILVAVDTVVGVFLGIAKVSLGQATLESLLSILIMIVFIQLSLRVRGHAARFNQTLSAMAGCDALLGTVLVPLLVLLKAGILPAMLFANLWLLLMIWIIVINAHILRHALAISFVTGILLSLAYLVMQFAINHFVFATEP